MIEKFRMNKLENTADLTQNVPLVGDVNRAAADFVPSREEFDESVADVPMPACMQSYWYVGHRICAYKHA